MQVKQTPKRKRGAASTRTNLHGNRLIDRSMQYGIGANQINAGKPAERQK